MAQTDSPAAVWRPDQSVEDCCTGHAMHWSLRGLRGNRDGEHRPERRKTRHASVLELSGVYAG